MKQAEEEMRKVAVGLVRCSTDMQENSIADQEAEVRAWGEETGHELIQIFRDEGVSGSELDRPGIRALLAFLQSSPEKGTLVAWHRSRLARPADPRQGIALELKIEEMGWDIHFLHGTQASGNVLVDAMMGLMEHHKNGQYLKDLSADTLRGLLQRVTAGEVPGGKVSYGYAKEVTDSGGEVRIVRRRTKHRKLSEERVRWVLGDPTEVEVVERIFELYTTTGSGFANVAKQLNDDGIPSPNGGRWVGGTIRDMLVNPIYVGDLIWNRESSSRFFRVVAGKITPQKKAHPSRQLSSRRRKTNFLANDPSDWIRIENHHEAIVERSTFEKAREIMKKRSSQRGRRRGQASPYPLSGIAFCACCQGPMYGRRLKAKQFTYRRYSCSSYEKAKECAPNAMDAELFEWALLFQLKDAYFERLGEFFTDEVPEEEIRKRLLERLEIRFATKPVGLDRKRLRLEKKGLGEKIQQAIENMGIVGPEFAPKIAEQIGKWERRRVEIEHELAKDDGREEERRLQHQNLEEVAEDGLRLLQMLKNLGKESTLEQRRAFFERAIKRIDLRYETLPPREGRKRSVHRFIDATVQATDLLGVTQEVAFSNAELLGRGATLWHNPESSF
ncbi:MAG: recombinase family protein [Planctomycetes bacterium]|nr:recombinase family protein [Planctomycetota bacterium]